MRAHELEKRRLASVIAIGFLLSALGFFFAACANGPEQERPDGQLVVTESAGGGDVSLFADNKSFSATSILVHAATATTVRFQNGDDVAHTFTVFLSEYRDGDIVADSGTVMPAETAEVVIFFGSPGRHPFRCQIHPQEMQGFIVAQ